MTTIENIFSDQTHKASIHNQNMSAVTTEYSICFIFTFIILQLMVGRTYFGSLLAEWSMNFSLHLKFKTSSI